MDKAIRNTVYSCTFFEDINTDRSFHVPHKKQTKKNIIIFFTDCYSRNIFYQISKVFPLHGQSFWFEIIIANTCLAYL